MKTFSELIVSIKKEIKEINLIQAQKELKDNSNIILIDVREKDEVLQGYIENSINIPRGFLEIRIENSIP
ncbi:MAG: molybdopterin biosynthesis protein MoeB, partial [Candidatus Sericytochromatia bacterium]|nr:molybdopterin biosynthesis protein MoeB [Candidatus Sericytochromatia bacterium]